MANQRASYLAEERSRRRKFYTHPRVNLSIVTARCAPSRAKPFSQVFHLHQRYCTGRQPHGALRDEVATRCILQPRRPQWRVDMTTRAPGVCRNCSVEARIVEKDTMVYFPDVNFGGMAREDRARGGFKIERDMQVLGEMGSESLAAHRNVFFGPTTAEATAFKVPSPPPATIVLLSLSAGRRASSTTSGTASGQRDARVATTCRQKNSESRLRISPLSSAPDPTLIIISIDSSGMPSTHTRSIATGYDQNSI